MLRLYASRPIWSEMSLEWYTPAMGSISGAAPKLDPSLSRPKKSKSRAWLWILFLCLAGFAGYRYFPQVTQGASGAPKGAVEKSTAKRPAAVVPVIAAAARRGDFPIYLTGLGSVTAYNTV